MPFPYAERLMADRDNLTGMAHTLLENAAGENRDLTEPERAHLNEWQTRCAEIDAELASVGAQLDSERAYSALRERIATTRNSAGDGGGENGGLRTRSRLPAVPAAPTSIGEMFTESPQFRNYGGAGTSGRFDLDASVVDGFAVRSADVASNGEARGPGGVIFSTDLHTRPVRFEPRTPAYQTPITEVVDRETVSVGSVEWVRWTPSPMTVAPVVPEGSPKPQAALTATIESGALDTYAHWVPITRQALEDEPRVRSIVEGKLREGLARAVEQALAGAIAADTDIPEMGDGSGWLLSEIRRGLALVQDAGYNANAVLLNSQDWAAFDIDILAMGVPSSATVGSTFWGLRPVASSSVPSGTAYVGDMRAGVTFFDRRVTSVYVTDSHADYFVSNKLVILAEARGLAVVTNPNAMVKATGDATDPNPRVGPMGPQGPAGPQGPPGPGA